MMGFYLFQGNKMQREAQPIPPIFEPEVAAKAIYFGATHDRREARRAARRCAAARRRAPGGARRQDAR